MSMREIVEMCTPPRRVRSLAILCERTRHGGAHKRRRHDASECRTTLVVDDDDDDFIRATITTSDDDFDDIAMCAPHEALAMHYDESALRRLVDMARETPSCAFDIDAGVYVAAVTYASNAMLAAFVDAMRARTVPVEAFAAAVRVNRVGALYALLRCRRPSPLDLADVVRDAVRRRHWVAARDLVARAGFVDTDTVMASTLRADLRVAHAIDALVFLDDARYESCVFEPPNWLFSVFVDELRRIGIVVGALSQNALDTAPLSTTFDSAALSNACDGSASMSVCDDTAICVEERDSLTSARDACVVSLPLVDTNDDTEEFAVNESHRSFAIDDDDDDYDDNGSDDDEWHSIIATRDDDEAKDAVESVIVIDGEAHRRKRRRRRRVTSSTTYMEAKTSTETKARVETNAHTETKRCTQTLDPRSVVLADNRDDLARAAAFFDSLSCDASRSALRARLDAATFNDVVRVIVDELLPRISRSKWSPDVPDAAHIVRAAQTLDASNARCRPYTTVLVEYALDALFSAADKNDNDVKNDDACLLTFATNVARMRARYGRATSSMHLRSPTAQMLAMRLQRFLTTTMTT